MDNYTSMGVLRRKWYVWEMNRSKTRVKPETKARQRREFEDAIIHLADEILEERAHNART